MKIFDWMQWTSDARLAVATDNNEQAQAAYSAVEETSDSVERAINRWYEHSEISLINAQVRAEGRAQVQVSETLADILGEAMAAYDLTGGAYDPRVEDSLDILGYGNGLSTIDLRVATDGTLACEMPQVKSLHQQVNLDRTSHYNLLTTEVTLDLTAIGKAFAADLGAELAAQAAGAPVLLSIGGDIATAGAEYSADENFSWAVLIQDLSHDPQAELELINNGAITTSSTQKRFWGENQAWHHIIDPRTGFSADPYLKTASVIAGQATIANALTTAAIVWGEEALTRIRETGYPVRLVTRNNTILHHAWPQESELPRPVRPARDCYSTS